jgi:hypothetical protein
MGAAGDARAARSLDRCSRLPCDRYEWLAAGVLLVLILSTSFLADEILGYYAFFIVLALLSLTLAPKRSRIAAWLRARRGGDRGRALRWRSLASLRLPPEPRMIEDLQRAGDGWAR